MTVKDLKEKLKEMPENAHVFMSQFQNEKCYLLHSVSYSDTMGGENEEGDTDFTDGVILSPNHLDE